MLAKKKHPAAMLLAWLFVMTLVLFPKGGLKVGRVPITWGYLLLGVTAPVLILVRLLGTRLRMSKGTFVAMALHLPLQVIFLATGLMYGVFDPAFALATALNIYFMPTMFLGVYPPFLRYIDGARLSLYFRWAVLLAALWGIFLFVLHPLTGHFIEIPYLTVNAADYGELEKTKDIARGLFFKLISTYNNGNVYGVCTLMLWPLYRVLEKKRWRRYAVQLALVLTLSRTVWVGIVMEQLLTFLLVMARQVKTFPRVHLGRAARQVMVLGVTVGLVLMGLVVSRASLSFLFDPTAGGRIGMIEELFHAPWLPSGPLGGVSEVVYSAAAQNWGYVGLVTFCLVVFSPLAVLLVEPEALKSPIRRAALKGLVLYIFLAAMDGAYDFIPTIAFYYFVYMIFLCGWPSRFELRRKREPAVDPVSYTTPGGAIA